MNERTTETAVAVRQEDRPCIWDKCPCPCKPSYSAQQQEIERLRTAISAAEAEARRYAESYPAHTDGRNTFLMLADRIAELAEVNND